MAAKKVNHRLSGLHAPTEKRKSSTKPKKPRSPASKLKDQQKRATMRTEDKKFASKRGKVTQERRNSKKSTAKSKTPTKPKVPKTPATIKNKAGKDMAVKHVQHVKVGSQIVSVPFTRPPNKNNPIGEVNRWKKVIAHLKAEAEKAKTPAQKKKFELAIAKADKERSAAGHKIAGFIKNARAKNPDLAGRAKQRAEARKAKREEAKKKAEKGKKK